MTTQAHTQLLTKLAESALILAALSPWDQVTLSDLCAQGDVTLAQCAQASVTKAHVCAHLDGDVDQIMLASNSKVDRTTSVRDRLFDVLMARFDAMEDHRSAWTSILNADRTEVLANLARRARLTRSGAWALEASGVSASDLRGAGRAIGLARILRLTQTVWLDDGPDLAKTMARLDQELRKGEAWVERANAASAFFGFKPVAEPTL